MVIGAGAAGLAANQGARMAGAARVVAVDRNAARCAPVVAAGRDRRLRPKCGEPGGFGALADEGRGGDVIIGSAGVLVAFRASFECVRPGGQVAWLGKVGVYNPVEFRWGGLTQEKRTVRSSYGGARIASPDGERTIRHISRASSAASARQYQQYNPTRNSVLSGSSNSRLSSVGRGTRMPRLLPVRA